MTGNGGIGYVKSVRGVLKILEIILVAIANGCVAYFWNNLGRKGVDSTQNHYIISFIGVTAAVDVIALVFFALFVAGSDLNKTAAVTSFLSAISLFVDSGLLAYVLIVFKNHLICKILEWFQFVSRCEQLTTGVVCGFIAGLVFLVDGIVHCRL